MLRVSTSVVDVATLLGALQAGQVTAAEVEQDFRLRAWVQRVPEKRTLAELMAWEPSTKDDFPLPGSFEEVDRARDRGELDDATYWRLWTVFIEAQGMRVS